VLWDTAGAAAPRLSLCSDFEHVLALDEAPEIIAVDMPIGLPDIQPAGGRPPCVALRKVLGDRRSSVFTVPSRAAVMAEDYAQACRINVENSEQGRKVSKQCFMIFPKIREIDALMTPALQARVFEVHPEGAFWAMNGCRPVPLPKKVKSRPDPDGLAFRRQLLMKQGFREDFLGQDAFRRYQAGPDDFLDACAAAWTAARILRGEAIRFPEEEPPCDAKGLRAEIWA
jgi:predicted RNase H-like nuclease